MLKNDISLITLQDKAEINCYEAMVRFLYNPTAQLRSVVEIKIEEYASIVKSSETISALYKKFHKLESNDRGTWEDFTKLIYAIFKEDTEIIDLFWKSVHKRNFEKQN